MTEDELKAIEARIDVDEDYDLDNDEDTENRFAQACVDRSTLVAEVRRLRMQPCETCLSIGRGPRPYCQAEGHVKKSPAYTPEDVQRAARIGHPLARTAAYLRYESAGRIGHTDEDHALAIPPTRCHAREGGGVQCEPPAGHKGAHTCSEALAMHMQKIAAIAHLLNWWCPKLGCGWGDASSHTERNIGDPCPRCGTKIEGRRT